MFSYLSLELRELLSYIIHYCIELVIMDLGPNLCAAVTACVLYLSRGRLPTTVIGWFFLFSYIVERWLTNKVVLS